MVPRCHDAANAVSFSSHRVALRTRLRTRGRLLPLSRRSRERRQPSDGVKVNNNFVSVLFQINCNVCMSSDLFWQNLKIRFAFFKCSKGPGV